MAPATLYRKCNYKHVINKFNRISVVSLQNLWTIFHLIFIKTFDKRFTILWRSVAASLRQTSSVSTLINTSCFILLTLCTRLMLWQRQYSHVFMTHQSKTVYIFLNILKNCLLGNMNIVVCLSCRYHSLATLYYVCLDKTLHMYLL